MNEILDIVQRTLDDLLFRDGVYSFWGRRSDVDANPNASEYIIYTIEDDSADVCADGKVMYRSMTIALQYYVKYSTARTVNGRKTAARRMEKIMKEMRHAGFGCSGGWSEIGDVDDVGFATFRSNYDIPHLMLEEIRTHGAFNRTPFNIGGE